ncbi:hypothetical protein ABZ645_20365 [Nocardiopsis alba]|uniref:hypothetical protein n=1 Tax=Nocardiopsis alba TaxID=53437 RepID=UPI0033E6477E
MLDNPPNLTVDFVAKELKTLRRGSGLGNPPTVSRISSGLRSHLLGTPWPPEQEASANQIILLVRSISSAVELLDDSLRLFVEVDLNLSPEHRHSTLTERQESLAAHLGYTAKTIRRKSEIAFRALAVQVIAGSSSMPWQAARTQRSSSTRNQVGSTGEAQRFWNALPGSRMDIVCSEIPEEERPYFASPSDRNYLRYAKFADLDTLIHVKTGLSRLSPGAIVRDFAPSEYHDANADTLIVIGGPPWNSKYREFLPQLPFYFEPNSLGEDDPLVLPQLDRLTMGPVWSPAKDLLEDLAVMSRLTLVQGTVVYLLGGCLTLGVLGAAKLFLHGPQSARNVEYMAEEVGQDDFVLVSEVRRIGGLTDTVDLTTAGPLVLMTRAGNAPFEVLVDNSGRYKGALPGS